MDTRMLRPGDEGVLEAFLATRRASSMFLRSNLRAAGIIDDGRALSGTYAGGFADGALVAAACHAWNGAVLVQAPTGAAEVARAACAATDRPVTVLSGPLDQVRAVRAGLGLDGAAVTHGGDETLYALALPALEVPGPLARGESVARAAEPRERDRLIEWRLAYLAEALGTTIDDDARAGAAQNIDRSIANGWAFVVAEAAAPARALAYAGYNAALPDIVQLGGVWTPPAARGRGLGRAVTCATLLAARDRGVDDAVLFTDNPAAARAYEALGFRAVDRYGLAVFAAPQRPR